MLEYNYEKRISAENIIDKLKKMHYIGENPVISCKTCEDLRKQNLLLEIETKKKIDLNNEFKQKVFTSNKKILELETKIQELENKLNKSNQEKEKCLITWNITEELKR